MTDAQKKKFQHSYSRHAEEFGLPNWAGSKAEELRRKFNDAVADILENGKLQPGTHKKPWNGQSREVNLYLHKKNGTTSYYYEDKATGTSISAGRHDPNHNE